MRGRMALLLGMAMLPAGAIAMQVGLNAVAVRQAAIEESYGRRALQSIDVERGMIDELRELLRVLATSPPLQRARAGDCQAWLGEVFAEYEQISALAVTDSNGRIRCSLPRVEVGSQLQGEALFRAARARDSFTIGYIDNARLTSGPVLAALEPLRDAQSHRTGFIGVSVTIERLRDVLNQSRALDHSRVAITDAEGRVLVSSTPEDNAPDLPTPAQIRSHRGPDPSFVAIPGGAAVVVPLHEPDLYIAVSWPSNQAGWRTWMGYMLSVAAPLLIWLLAVAAGWFAIEIYVARPLSSLEAAARSYARGEEVHDGPTLASAPIEIRSLRRTLAAMAKTLRGRETRLVEALGEERALLREVHHRVKNNLQMVASLLSIQSRGARDESEAWGLARAHDRVQLLSQVHQRIYASGEVREIRLDELAAEVARQLIAARGPQAQQIQLDLELSEARANADRAVPLAFLIGEGISTALDALGDGARAQLKLWLSQDEDGGLRFAIDANADGKVSATAIGARLIDAFGRQLGALVGRHPDRPYMIWAYVPPVKE
jgi:two-component sensor histidine kinase